MSDVFELGQDDIERFLLLVASIHNRSWPDIPFCAESATETILEHIKSNYAVAFGLEDGDRRAILMLDVAPMMAAADGQLVAVETCWGATEQALKGTAQKLITEAKQWARAKGLSGLVLHMEGARKGGARFVEKAGGRVLHTAGYWRL